MINKEFLQKRLEGLRQQADDLLRKKFMVDGAIADCQDMLAKIEEDEGEENKVVESAVQ